MKVKGQYTIYALLLAFMTIIAFGAISPVIYTVVSTYSAFGTNDRLVVQLFPLFMALGILMSIVMFIWQGRTSGGQA